MCGWTIWCGRETSQPALGKCLTKSVLYVLHASVLKKPERGGDTAVTKKSDAGKSTHRNNLNWTFHIIISSGCSNCAQHLMDLCLPLWVVVCLITTACAHQPHYTLTHSYIYLLTYALNVLLTYCMQTLRIYLYARTYSTLYSTGPVWDKILQGPSHIVPERIQGDFDPSQMFICGIVWLWFLWYIPSRTSQIDSASERRIHFAWVQSIWIRLHHQDET